VNVLAVGAHPDDIELQCAGTLARFAAAGHRVHMAAVSSGDMGHHELRPPEVAATRERELRASAAVIAASVLWLGIHGPYLADTPAHRLAVLDAVRQARADLVITHAPDDYHDNHRAVHDMVWSAVFQATVPHVRTPHPALPAIPRLVYMDNFAGVRFQPNLYVDIAETLETKLHMLRQHRSQLEWMRAHDGLDLEEMVRVAARYRGFQCGAAYAEGFRQPEAWPLPRDGFAAWLPAR
jgi:LmbE family N-acetylglucosaminyl deacetylase